MNKEKYPPTLWKHTDHFQNTSTFHSMMISPITTKSQNSKMCTHYQTLGYCLESPIVLFPTQTDASRMEGLKQLGQGISS